MRALDHYREIWVADFEFRQPPGETPGPICMVAREFRSGRLLRLWADELSAMASAPFDTGPKSLFVAYYASSELGCFLSLGWSLPDRILDLFAEFRCQTNGLILPNGSGLLGALTYHGFDAMAGVEKESMRDLAIRGSSFTNDEKEALVDYCQTDVDALAKLLPAMMPKLDLPRALLRGRYMAAAARIERNGIPVDTQVLQAMRSQWKSIKMKLIDRIDSDWNVYEGTSFKYDRFAQRSRYPLAETRYGLAQSKRRYISANGEAIPGNSTATGIASYTGFDATRIADRGQRQSKPLYAINISG